MISEQVQLASVNALNNKAFRLLVLSFILLAGYYEELF